MGAADEAEVGARTAVGAAWLIAWRMVTRALGLVSTLVLARLLVPADFGLVAMATTFAFAVEALSEIGLLEALVRRPDTDRAAYDTAFTMQVLRGLATGGVIAVGASALGSWFDEPRLVPLLFVLAGLAVASGFENIGIVEFRRTLRFDVEFKLQFVPRICQFFVTIAAAWALQSHWALLIGIAVSKLGRLVMTYLIHPYRPGLTLSRWRELVGFSFWTWASSIATLVWERSDAFILGPVVGAAELGVYLLAVELAVLPVTELVGPASRALFAGFALLQNQGTKLVGVALPVICALLTIIVPLAIAVSATAGQIVAVLLDPKWYGVASLVSIFAWLCVFSPFSWVSSTVLMAHGAVRRNFVAIALAAAVKAAVVYAASLTGRTDVVALAALGCVAIESVLFLLQLRKLGDMGARAAAGGFVRVGLAGAVAVAALYLSGLGWQPPAGSSVGALLYGASVGMAALGICLSVQFAAWWAAGRPDGPEVQVLVYLKKFLPARPSVRL